ncbi:hypothetical protein HDU76_006194 [Blyttiomyces sp. JEL0837]|nr:hypothetical protein HDU76_006194 [Blyttiomyces sp. JEL0837]
MPVMDGCDTAILIRGPQHHVNSTDADTLRALALDAGWGDSIAERHPHHQPPPPPVHSHSSTLSNSNNHPTHVHVSQESIPTSISRTLTASPGPASPNLSRSSSLRRNNHHNHAPHQINQHQQNIKHSSQQSSSSSTLSRGSYSSTPNSSILPTTRPATTTSSISPSSSTSTADSDITLASRSSSIPASTFPSHDSAGPTTTTTTTSSQPIILPGNRMVPIIAVTSRAGEADRKYYLSLGMDRVFAKPIGDPEGLVEVVKGFLDERRRESESESERCDADMGDAGLGFNSNGEDVECGGSEGIVEDGDGLEDGNTTFLNDDDFVNGFNNGDGDCGEGKDGDVEEHGGSTSLFDRIDESEGCHPFRQQYQSNQYHRKHRRQGMCFECCHRPPPQQQQEHHHRERHHRERPSVDLGTGNCIGGNVTSVTKTETSIPISRPETSSTLTSVSVSTASLNFNYIEAHRDTSLQRQREVEVSSNPPMYIKGNTRPVIQNIPLQLKMHLRLHVAASNSTSAVGKRDRGHGGGGAGAGQDERVRRAMVKRKVNGGVDGVVGVGTAAGLGELAGVEPV